MGQLNAALLTTSNKLNSVITPRINLHSKECSHKKIGVGISWGFALIMGVFYAVLELLQQEHIHLGRVGLNPEPPKYTPMCTQYVLSLRYHHDC